jgi:hypothetical protein
VEAKTAQNGAALQPPTPLTDHELFRTFVGRNAHIYEATLDGVEAHDPTLKRFRLGWCWPAFFFTVPWLLYRKLWGYAALFTFMPIAMNLVLPSSGGSAALAGLAGLWGKSIYAISAAKHVRKIATLSEDRNDQIAQSRRAGVFLGLAPQSAPSSSWARSHRFFYRSATRDSYVGGEHF